MAIKFCVNASKSAVETIELINKAYGSAAMSRAIVYRWYSRFRGRREDVKDDARSGRPSTARTYENLESVRRLLTEDHRTALQMIADRLNILMGQGECFWENVSTGHGTWCFAYDLATKRQCRVGGAKLSKTKETAISKIASEDNNLFFSTQKV